MQPDLERATFQAGDKQREIAVLVYEVHFPIERVAQLYRDRVDAVNAFGKMKNQLA